MIGNEAKNALANYFSTFIFFFIVEVLIVYYNITSFTANLCVFVPCILIICLLLKSLYKGNAFQIAIRAAFLGFVFALGIYIRLIGASHIQIFGGYMCVMAFFHFSEFIAIALVQPKLVTYNSFVLNNGREYTVAAISSWVEFFIESYFFPGLKEIYWLSNIGLGVCVVAELLRKTSILTAGSSFNHIVQSEKSSDHVLVTHGVYRWFRHPSYVAWFYWSIGTQIVLANPFCIPAYAIASWLFFKSRIFYEEITLLNFFGQNYCDYQEKVGTGIPFIEGYRI